MKESNGYSPFYCKLTFLRSVSLEISKILRKYNMECVFSNKGKIKDFLGNPKEKHHEYTPSNVLTTI